MRMLANIILAIATATLLGSSIASDGTCHTDHPTWNAVASEGQTFTTTLRIARYGANGSWVYRPVDGTTYCSSRDFGNELANVSGKSCQIYSVSSTWVDVASEAGTFGAVDGQIVRYGSGSTWVYAALSGAQKTCSTATFGMDPLYGVAKTCQIAQTPLTWSDVAIENGAFTIKGTKQVRYGRNGTWATRTVTDYSACSNAAAGYDPVPGVQKICFAQSRGPVWMAVANEGETLRLASQQVVAYGVDRRWVRKQITGTTTCSSSVFGDPAPGTLKFCKIYNPEADDGM